MNEDLTSFIIKELGKPADRKEIIRRVCKEGGLHWKEAERLVILIEARHYRTTATRHTPVLLFLSIGLLLVGIGLLASDIEILFALFQKEMVSLSSSHFIGLISGFGITTAGMLGLWKALGYIFPH